VPLLGVLVHPFYGKKFAQSIVICCGVGLAAVIANNNNASLIEQAVTEGRHVEQVRQPHIERHQCLATWRGGGLRADSSITRVATICELGELELDGEDPPPLLLVTNIGSSINDPFGWSNTRSMSAYTSQTMPPAVIVIGWMAQYASLLMRR
jgi:hypothetical protein